MRPTSVAHRHLRRMRLSWKLTKNICAVFLNFGNYFLHTASNFEHENTSNTWRNSANVLRQLLWYFLFVFHEQNLILYCTSENQRNLSFAFELCTRKYGSDFPFWIYSWWIIRNMFWDSKASELVCTREKITKGFTTSPFSKRMKMSSVYAPPHWQWLQGPMGCFTHLDQWVIRKCSHDRNGNEESNWECQLF